MSLQVLGRDPGREAYRIRTDVGACAWVPECLIDTLRPGDRPTHQEAYQWIAAHRTALQNAVDRRRAGKAPRPPFDLVTLTGDDLSQPDGARDT